MIPGYAASQPWYDPKEQVWCVNLMHGHRMVALVTARDQHYLDRVITRFKDVPSQPEPVEVEGVRCRCGSLLEIRAFSSHHGWVDEHCPACGRSGRRYGNFGPIVQAVFHGPTQGHESV